MKGENLIRDLLLDWNLEWFSRVCLFLPVWNLCNRTMANNVAVMSMRVKTDNLFAYLEKRVLSILNFVGSDLGFDYMLLELY